jgi:hypothetical protein
VRSSRSGMSGINHPVKNLNRDPRQANKRLSQQNLPTGDMVQHFSQGTAPANDGQLRDAGRCGYRLYDA